MTLSVIKNLLYSDMCGPASLKIVLDYYGLEKNEQELAKLTDVISGVGIGDKDLARAAETLGFKTLVDIQIARL